jgi:hypothetical protein
MTDKKDILKKFQTETKEIEVSAWGARVKIRKLTIAEQSEVDSLMLKDASTDEVVDGKVKVDLKLANEAIIRKVSYALVEPKFKPAELAELPNDAFAGIQEIEKALKEWDKPKDVKKGNDKHSIK